MGINTHIKKKTNRWREGEQREGPEWAVGLVRVVGSSPGAASCPLTHSIHARMVGPTEGHYFCSLYMQLWFGFARISYRWKFYRRWKQDRAFIAQPFPSSEVVADSSFLASLGADGVEQKCFTLRKPSDYVGMPFMITSISWSSELQSAGSLWTFCWTNTSHKSLSLFLLCLHMHTQKKQTISWGAGF